MKITTFLLMAICLVACGKATSKPKENTTPTLLADGHYEYLFVEAKDSSFLNIDVKGAEINGDLTWLPEVSDGNTGKFSGTQANGKINGYWKYEMEGSAPSQEIVMEIADKALNWKVYELIEDTVTHIMHNDTSKFVTTNKFQLKNK